MVHFQVNTVPTCMKINCFQCDSITIMAVHHVVVTPKSMKKTINMPHQWKKNMNIHVVIGEFSFHFFFCDFQISFLVRLFCVNIKILTSY